MENKSRWVQFLKKSISYILVAVLSATGAFLIAGYDPPSKLDVLEAQIAQRFIGEADEKAMEDAAAAAMVTSLGDRWSYYLTAEEYKEMNEDRESSYVGIGITIMRREDGTGYDIQQVEPDGPAQEAGIQPGDILAGAGGQSAAEMDTAALRKVIQGPVGTKVEITVLREGRELRFQVTRQRIKVVITSGKMLENHIGLVTIRNFHDDCAQQTIDVVEDLLDQGAKGLIFDVRNNGGGYLEELTELLDYLLPEGVIIQRVNYKGVEKVDKSDAKCLNVPMAVLVNGRSYSAAEFFAAALEEYDWAVTVGEPTSGKGYYQIAISLPDGSAVNLSVGKYLTPKGVNLQEQGGLTPGIQVDVDEETDARIYAKLLPAGEDPQVTAAAEALAGQ